MVEILPRLRGEIVRPDRRCASSTSRSFYGSDLSRSLHGFSAMLAFEAVIL